MKAASKTKAIHMPSLRSDAEAGRFVDSADLPFYLIN